MERPFAPRDLKDGLRKKLDDFLADPRNHFADLYKSYSWRNDAYKDDNGFAKIRCLENSLIGNTNLTLEDIESVIQWGDPSGTSCKPVIVDRSLFNEFREHLADVRLIKRDPGNLAYKLARSVRYVGPTYASKVLRFVHPHQYGAIDRRLVLVFGKHNAASECYQWIPSLIVRDSSIEAFDTYFGWHPGYTKWINILRYFAQKLNSDQELSVECPHPQRFVDAGVRCNGIWTCADVEMALFAYASKCGQHE